ncbi:MAG TPA: HAMP domain-containing sensor histidine kinase, partial [Nitrososphaeraceae archaeon]|nr:HAMP domain-containing sensor histidine kinase [Nitrososphaeraceae archaeon]
LQQYLVKTCMMHKEQLKDKCALCGKPLATANSNTGAGTSYIEETILNTYYKFDTRECATMFKRILDVYGKEFQPLLGDKQYISDPFWDRVLPKEDEIKVMRAQEKLDQSLINIGDDDIDASRKIARKNQKAEVVSIIKDSYKVQKMLKQLIQSAKENVSLAIPTTATDLFISSSPPDISSSSSSSSSDSSGYSSSFSCSVFFQQIKDVAIDNEKLSIRILTNAGRQLNQKEQGGRYVPSSTPGQEDEDETKFSNIQVKHMERDYSSLSENIVILVVDRRASLAIELEERKQGEGDGDKETILNHKKGSSYRMIKLATYSENKSTVLSYISIFESLWKEIELNEKITSLLAEIKGRENIERDFIHMAAHELRAPIQPVLGLAQFLQTKKNVDTKEQEELLSIIIRNARRLNILTENLLDLAKIESNTLKLQKESFSLTELIFEAIADMKSQLSNNQIVANVEYNEATIKDYQDDHNLVRDFKLGGKILDLNKNPPLVLVEADKIRIMQVVSNLLTNAIKFTRGGKVTIILDDGISRIATIKERRGESTGRMVVVSFRDSGTGIDPQIIDKIFEKFVTKSEKGTGLGLFISKKIIEAHGGKIWAKNNPDAEGATIAFSLPQPHISIPNINQ